MNLGVWRMGLFGPNIGKMAEQGDVQGLMKLLADGGNTTRR